MSSKENSLTNRSEMVVHVPLVQAHVSHSTILSVAGRPALARSGLYDAGHLGSRLTHSRSGWELCLMDAPGRTFRDPSEPIRKQGDWVTVARGRHSVATRLTFGHEGRVRPERSLLWALIFMKTSLRGSTAWKLLA